MSPVRPRPGHQVAFSGELYPDTPTIPRFSLPDYGIDAQRAAACEIATADTPNGTDVMRDLLHGLRKL